METPQIVFGFRGSLLWTGVLQALADDPITLGIGVEPSGTSINDDLHIGLRGLQNMAL